VVRAQRMLGANRSLDAILDGGQRGCLDASMLGWGQISGASRASRASFSGSDRPQETRHAKTLCARVSMRWRVWNTPNYQLFTHLVIVISFAWPPLPRIPPCLRILISTSSTIHPSYTARRQETDDIAIRGQPSIANTWCTPNCTALHFHGRRPLLTLR
jgi:hypothetical protein